MANTLFRGSDFPLHLLVGNIDRGEIALPELQRPFVWKNSAVRDLFDSMYRGFPVGNLLLWDTGAEPGARQIGQNQKFAKAARWLIVDGQQRLTSLYSVFTGIEVVREDYSTSRIVLAFQPRNETFAVSDAAIQRDPEFLHDITRLWQGETKKVKRAFFKRLEESKGALDDETKDRLDDALDRLVNLQNFPFHVVELDANIEEEQLAEIFVRINSGGVKLNQADFILTIMSVFWDEGRTALENFAREAKQPSQKGPSPYNKLITPAPDQLLRVSIAVALRRAALRHAYSILRGKDLKTGIITAEARDVQFSKLQVAQKHVLKLTLWHEYLRCLERAGFRNPKMISSQTAVFFTYAMWLVGRIDYDVPVDDLRELIARWFFMAHTTRRYSGSFETQVERDLTSLPDGGTAADFTSTLDKIINDQLTNDFWEITLPNELATSASHSPALSAYIAALVILDADALMSTGKIRDRLDPTVVSVKGIEQHHLFPKEYLKASLGISDSKQINQIANKALVEWNVNIEISADSPKSYWPTVLKTKNHLTDERIATQRRLHALPSAWPDIDFEDFLAQRRRLMAEVTRQGFEQLAQGSRID